MKKILQNYSFFKKHKSNDVISFLKSLQYLFVFYHIKSKFLSTLLHACHELPLPLHLHLFILFHHYSAYTCISVLLNYLQFLKCPASNVLFMLLSLPGVFLPSCLVNLLMLKYVAQMFLSLNTSSRINHFSFCDSAMAYVSHS